MLLHSWAPQCLRAAGLNVVETAGWQARSHGSFPDSISACWHHDASPPGDSPGALNWMISNWDNASANFWVNRYGVWYCVGTGVSWHAGKTAPGMPTSFNSFGVETDQTVNETPAPALLDATRRGMAALLKRMGRGGSSLHFHKTVATPPGRKQDPWFDPGSNNQANWPGELARERAILDGSTPPPTSTGDWFDMATQADLEAAIRKCIPEIANAVLYFGLGGDKNDTVEKRLKNTLTDIKNGVTNVPQGVWGHMLKSQADSKNYAAQSFLTSIDEKVTD